jgi:hypothetical protein
MFENLNTHFLKNLCRAVIAIVAGGAVAAPAAYARPSKDLIVVLPTDLPELAQRTGEAMLLHDTVDGRTLLYVEQDHGARLAIFDVTDPGHVKGEGSVHLDVPGPFDFVSALGNQAEVIRFRQGQGDAVLSLHKIKAPSLQTIQRLTLQGPTLPLGAGGFTVAGRGDAMAQSTRGYQLVDTASSEDFSHVFDVKQIRVEVTKYDTGTTFLLTERGLYLVRRPVIETDNEFRERNRKLNYAGGG